MGKLCILSVLYIFLIAFALYIQMPCYMMPCYMMSQYSDRPHDTSSYVLKSSFSSQYSFSLRFYFDITFIPLLHMVSTCHGISSFVVVVPSLSRIRLFVTPWTTPGQAPLSTGFSRQEYWSGLPCPPPGNFSNPGIEPTFLTSPALAGGFFTTEPTLTLSCLRYVSGESNII